jgi:hypothetical protein
LKLLGCGFYRCSSPYKYLSSLGFDVTLTNKFAWPSEMMTGVDLLVLQRQHNSQVYYISEQVKKSGAKVIVELDDYFHDLPANNPARSSYPKGGEEVRNMEKFMQLADIMTVSTPGLKNAYEKFNPNVFICPNVLDLSLFPVKKPLDYKPGDVFRLGWAGSATHHDDLMTVIKPVTEIMMENKLIQFIFIGQDYRHLFPKELHHRMECAGHTFPIDEQNNKPLFYSPDGISPVVKYYKLLNDTNVHLAIAPLLELTFNKCKSYVKLLEYGISGIPFVAAGFGPYFDYINKANMWDNKRPVGRLANKATEWRKALRDMIGNNEYRKQTARNNADFILERHTIEYGAQNWLTALASIGIEPGESPGKYEEILANE